MFRENFLNVGTEEGGCQALLAEMGLDHDGMNAEGRAVGVMRAHGIVLEGGAHAEGAVDEREQVGGDLVKEAVKEGSGLGLPESHALQGGGFILSGVGGEGGRGEREGEDWEFDGLVGSGGLVLSLPALFLSPR